MKLQMMAVYDLKARAYLPPFFVPHVDVGLRHIGHAAQDPQHQLCKFAEDFEIFHLGEFDDSTGYTEVKPNPLSFGRVLVLKKLHSPEEHRTIPLDLQTAEERN